MFSLNHGLGGRCLRFGGGLVAAALVLAVPLFVPTAAGSHTFAASVGDNIVVNGDFEQPVIQDLLVHYYAGTTFGGWHVDSGSVDLNRSYWQPASGAQSMDLNGFEAGTLSQVLATVPGWSYTLSFQFAGNPVLAPVVKHMEVFWGTESLGVFQFDTTGHSQSNMGWRPETRIVTASTDSTTLRFVSHDSGLCGPAFDAVSVVPAGDLNLGPLPAAATLGQPYDQTIGLTSGTAPYTFSLVSGSPPAGMTLSTSGRLSGTPTAPGSSTFTVEATDSSSPAKLGLRTYRIDVLDLASISVQVSRPGGVGSALTVTALAHDSSGHTLTAYNGPAGWSDLSGSLSPSTPTSFVNGVSRTTATIGVPARDDRITVTSGGASGQSGAFNVVGPLAGIRVRVRTPVTHGAPFQVKADARDAAGNPLTGYAGSATWSSLDGALTPATPLSFVNGVSTTFATIGSPFRGDRIAITSGGVTGQSGLFTVVGPVATIRVRVTTPVTHGVAFQVKATALDALGTPVVGYTGTASWTSLDNSLSPSAPSAFVNGVSTTTATIPSAFANDRITVAKGGITGSSGLFSVH